jgi:hypothetical protein
VDGCQSRSRCTRWRQARAPRDTQREGHEIARRGSSRTSPAPAPRSLSAAIVFHNARSVRTRRSNRLRQVRARRERFARRKLHTGIAIVSIEKATMKMPHIRKSGRTQPLGHSSLATSRSPQNATSARHRRAPSSRSSCSSPHGPSPRHPAPLERTVGAHRPLFDCRIERHSF